MGAMDLGLQGKSVLVTGRVMGVTWVSVAATTLTLRAPADCSNPAISIAAEYHMFRHAISDTTSRLRTDSGCVFTSDRMGSEGARYHT